MAAAAFRPMMAAVREEAAIAVSEVEVAARNAATTELGAAARQTGRETFNPLVVREAAEASAKRAMEPSGGQRTPRRARLTPESSFLSMLCHTKPAGGGPSMTTSTSTASGTNSFITEAGAEVSNTVQSTVRHESSAVGQQMEQDMGMSVHDAMLNSAESGAQDVSEETAEFVKGMLRGEGRGGAVANRFMPSSNSD